MKQNNKFEAYYSKDFMRNKPKYRTKLSMLSVDDIEMLPYKEKPKSNHRSEEMLRKRWDSYLLKNVGRQWASVKAEIIARHPQGRLASVVRGWVEEYVTTDEYGNIVSSNSLQTPIARTYDCFYVCPNTGTLQLEKAIKAPKLVSKTKSNRGATNTVNLVRGYKATNVVSASNKPLQANEFYEGCVRVAKRPYVAVAVKLPKLKLNKVTVVAAIWGCCRK